VVACSNQVAPTIRIKRGTAIRAPFDSCHKEDLQQPGVRSGTQNHNRDKGGVQMRFRMSIVTGIVVSLFLPGFAFGEPNMEDGMWEMTVKTEMPGMPMEMPPMKFTQCLTKKDLVPQKKERNDDCKMTSMKVDGSTVTWAVQCRTKDGTMDGTGKITYKGSGFDGVMKMSMDNRDRGKMDMTQHMSGHRIGDCK
jgi:hypothetical protein